MAAPPSKRPAARAREDVSIAVRSAGAQALLGPPPLVHGEDEGPTPGAHAELLARVRAAVAPKDVLEEFWVREIVDLSWEAVRLRRMKANVITAARRAAMERVLGPLVNGSFIPEVTLMPEETRAHELAAGWYKRDEKNVKEVERVLGAAGLSMDVVAAMALSMSLDDIERIDRMAANAEARRNAVLREVARHRAAFADELRRSTGAVRDAEFTEVPRT